MPFSDILLRFRDATGRDDLVGSDGSDLGAGRFINDGQRYLDSQIPLRKTWARYQRDVPSGEFRLAVPNIRSVEAVFLITATAERKLAKARSYDKFLECYPNLAESAPGCPKDWVVTNRLAYPQNERLSEWNYGTEFTHGKGEIELAEPGETEEANPEVAEQYAEKLILIAPRPDSLVTIRVNGLFFSKQLVELTDASWWTEANPDLLNIAACYKLEVFYRNMEGSRDWLAAMNAALHGVVRDEISEDVYDATQIRD